MGRAGNYNGGRSDLSHYHDYETARRLDAATAAAIEHGDWASLGPHRACGGRALAGLLLETGRRGLKIRHFWLCNSGDTAGSRDRVVGYGAWMFAHRRRELPALHVRFTPESGPVWRLWL